MQVEFVFKPESCWYRESCKNYGTQNCTKMCNAYYSLYNQTKYALLTYNQTKPPKLDVPNCDKKAYDRLINIRSNIVDFVRRGKNIVIYSKFTGNGKTTWATKLLMQYLSQTPFLQEKAYGLFIPCTKLLVLQKLSYGGYQPQELKHIYENIERANLVVWDDLITETLSKHDSSFLYAFIDSRVSAGLSNIFTLNGTEKQCAEFLGDKLYSRVFRTSEVVEFVNEDMRIPKSEI